MGGAVKITRTDMSAQDLRCAAKRTRDGRVVRRILAIALVPDDVDRATAARSSGMDRQTPVDRVHPTMQRALVGFLIGVARVQGHACPWSNRRCLWLGLRPGLTRQKMA